MGCRTTSGDQRMNERAMPWKLLVNSKIDEPKRLKRQFVHAARVVSKAPVKLLSYPRTLPMLAARVSP